MNIEEIINNSLFFTGAGASHDAKCKMSGEMLSEMKSIVCSTENKYFSDIEKETIKFLFSCLRYHAEWRTLETNSKYSFDTNIEELALLIRRIKNRENFLPYPVTGNWADKLISLETKYNEQERNKTGESLFSAIERTIKEKLYPMWLEIDNTKYLEPLDDFFNVLSEKNFQLEWVSLNNDMVIEKHYEKLSAQPYRGFYSGEWRGFDSPTNREEFNRINLYKLHGSLDWVRMEDGSILEKRKIEELTEQEIRTDHDPFIIFGHGTKFFSVDPFFSLIQKFNQLLKERTFFFIIGYSFFDPYINNLLFQAVNYMQEKNKKIIIVNPFFAKEILSEESFWKSTKFGTVLDNENSEGKRKLVDYMEGIQKNAFYSEIPEFNITQISSESIYFIKEGTEEFLNKFFKDSGALLSELINQFEKERKQYLPFK